MSHTPSSYTEHRLELRGIRKAYRAVVANDGINLSVDPGEIHAVVGENGAGKSALMKIVYGMVFQHFALFDTLTVPENIALALPGKPGTETLSKKITEVANRYGSELPESVAAEMKAADADIVSGKLKPFKGEIKDQAGTVKIAKGREMADADIKGMTWLIEGAQGTLPQN